MLLLLDLRGENEEHEHNEDGPVNEKFVVCEHRKEIEGFFNLEQLLEPCFVHKAIDINHRELLAIGLPEDKFVGNPLYVLGLQNKVATPEGLSNIQEGALGVVNGGNRV